MKKIIICSIGLLFANQAISQNWGGQNPLKSTIDPSKSAGYINWSPVPNADYEVRIYTKNSDGTFTQIESKSTDLNYARLNLSYMTQPNIYYNVVALNNGTGNVIMEGEISPAIPGTIPFDYTCGKKCNGSTYAWELYLAQQEDSDGWQITDPGKIFLKSTGQMYDQENAVYVPYWQAMDHNQYNALSNGHPYKTINCPTCPIATKYLYKHIQITTSTPGGPFYNSQGAQVNSGWLIEKKMDQFSYMAGYATNFINPSSTVCDMTLTGSGSWLATFNTYLDPTTTQTPPTSSPFVTTIPTTLACNNAIGIPVKPDNLFEIWNPGDYWCWTTNANTVPDEIISILDCITGLTAVSGVEVLQLNGPSQPIIWNFNSSNQQSNISKLEKLSQGLYAVNIFTTNGNVFPLVMEQKTTHGVIRKDRDYVKLSVSPNQIQNDILKFKVSSEKNMSASIKIHSLNGTELYSENVQLSETADLIREIPVNGVDYPYNQMRVTIQFNDNTVLQQTALR